MLPYLKGRGVEYFVHFTRIENVASILKYGLLGRNDLESADVPFHQNDRNRFDYQPNAICLSVSFPNYKMFYASRQNHPEQDWAVLRISPEIVRDKRCAFSHVNAAKREIAKSRIEDRMQKRALESMFSDHDGMPKRTTLNIPDSYTTNPQAEVLSLDAIEPNYIRDVIFDSKGSIKDLEVVRALVREYKEQNKFLYGPRLFAPRRDYEHWRNR